MPFISRHARFENHHQSRHHISGKPEHLRSRSDDAELELHDMERADRRRFDSTGMFHWCPSQTLSNCIIVSGDFHILWLPIHHLLLASDGDFVSYLRGFPLLLTEDKPSDAFSHFSFFFFFEKFFFHLLLNIAE